MVKARKRISKKISKKSVKNFWEHFQWKRIKAYWFSKAGARRIGKIFLAVVLISIIALGALFLFYKAQLSSIQLDKINVSDTVNTYLDRNGKVLWEDKGSDSYRLTVDGSDISTYMRQATVAIEDKNFYNHAGFDFGATVRAAFSTLAGKGVQGGSTLTQQLIKQVYFSDEASKANRGGIGRKIKELILAVELEKMYDKEQIITMYLNESPYGGRRNGVESAARTYFGKPAKELNLAESALIAAIPNNPAILNPYNVAGNEALIERQHKVLDSMVEMGYISQDQANEAKQVAILDTIKPESDQYGEILAPHFVLQVKDWLEEKYGMQTMRSGGYTIKTTLDYEAQQIAEEAVATGAKITYRNGSDNISLSSVDVESGQIIAMVGSVDWNTPIYGEVNASTMPLEPGSSIKPILDYATLFKERDGQNYGPGSVLRDENIDSIYCAGYTGGSCQLRNASGAFYGNVTIRQSLGNSLNIGAVKALYIDGIDDALEVAHGLGDLTYCADNDSAGLSMAIGSGCNVRAIEHANAYASLARGGVYKPLAYVLEMKDSRGNTVESWQDSEGTRVVDEQVAYMLSDILADPSARSITFGSQARSFGFVVPGVWTATKTGTTTTTNSSIAKDAWIASYSTAVATTVWNGKHNGGALTSNSNEVVRRVVNDYMEKVHKTVYTENGKWKSGDKPKKPDGIQTLTVNGHTDIWPSWYSNKNATGGNSTQELLTFNRYNHMLASACTKEEYKIQIYATKTIDPTTKQETWYVPSPYDRNHEDDCSYMPPSVASVSRTEAGNIHISLSKGSLDFGNYTVYVDGVEVEGGGVSGNSFNTNYVLKESGKSVRVTVTDAGGYETSWSGSL